MPSHCCHAHHLNDSVHMLGEMPRIRLGSCDMGRGAERPKTLWGAFLRPERERERQERQARSLAALSWCPRAGRTSLRSGPSPHGRRAGGPARCAPTAPHRAPGRPAPTSPVSATARRMPNFGASPGLDSPLGPKGQAHEPKSGALRSCMGEPTPSGREPTLRGTLRPRMAERGRPPGIGDHLLERWRAASGASSRRAVKRAAKSRGRNKF